MNKLWLITRVMLKGSLSSLGSSSKRKVKIPPVLGWILMAFLMISSITVPLGALVDYLYDALVQINQQDVLLSLSMVIICITIFFFGIISVMTVFYFSKDVEFYMPLPLKSWQIIGGKFAATLIYEYLVEFIILTPVIVMYGINSGASPLYYMYSIIIFILLPVVPLVLAAVINMVIMRFSNMGKHKDALRIGSGVLAIALSLGLNMAIQNMAKSNVDPSNFMLVLSKENGLLNMVSKLFPSVQPAALSMANSGEINGLINLVIFVLITILALAIFFILGEKLYFKGVLGVSEVYSKRKKLSGEDISKETRKNSQIAAYTMKELRILFRTPAYIINCVLVNFIWPVLIFIFMMNGEISSDPDIQAIKQVINSDAASSVIVAVMLAAGFIIGGGNGITATAISREGQGIFISKYIPMSYGKQILSKIISAMALNGVVIILTVTTLVVLIQPSVLVVAISFVFAMAGALTICMIGIILDLRFPKLNWDNEQKAVKQNFNFVIITFLSMGIAAGIVFLVVKLQLGLTGTTAVFLISVSVLIAVLFSIIKMVAVKWYSRIEV